MFFYRDGALGVLVGILGVLVGVFDVLAGVFLIQSSPFRVPYGKKYANAVGALLTNIIYGPSYTSSSATKCLQYFTQLEKLLCSV